MRRGTEGTLLGQHVGLIDTRTDIDRYRMQFEVVPALFDVG
jgi:hypothetical protein